MDGIYGALMRKNEDPKVLAVTGRAVSPYMAGCSVAPAAPDTTLAPVDTIKRKASKVDELTPGHDGGG